MTLSELIEALENATGPSRELDARISAVVEPYRFDAPGFTPERPIPEFDLDKSEGVIRFHKGGIMDLRFFPPVTSSIDAAMQFSISNVDDGATDIEVAHRSISGNPHGRAEICGPTVFGMAKSRTPAMALVLATLKAIKFRGDA